MDVAVLEPINDLTSWHFIVLVDARAHCTDPQVAHLKAQIYGLCDPILRSTNYLCYRVIGVGLRSRRVWKSSMNQEGVIRLVVAVTIKKPETPGNMGRLISNRSCKI